jgi:hypothetical protein
MLSGADLSEANLSGANLSNVKNMPCFQIVPEIGSFIAFKKLADGVLACLEIPKTALRCSSTGRKCRASHAKVISLTKGGKKVKTGVSCRDKNFRYEVGKSVKTKEPFCPDIREECASGIHFFLTKKEAEEYNL